MIRLFRPILAGATLRDRAVACLGALVGIGLTGLASRAMLGGETALPLMMTGSMGASAVLIFVVPASPLAQPWSVIGGHVSSALVGILIGRLIPDPILACGVAVAAAIAVMSVLRCLHPPGGSTALIGVLGGPVVHGAGFPLAFVPIGLNAVLLAAAGFLFHRFLSGHAWPHRATAAATAQGPQVLDSDIDAALTTFGEPLDVDRGDLQTIVKLALENAASRKP